MIPPVSGREMDPPPELEPENPQMVQVSPRYTHDYTARVKILVFGVLVGALVAVIYAFFTSILTMLAASSFDSTFAREGRTWFTSFVMAFSSSAPLLMVAATLAAAADALIRRGQRDARATRQILRGLSGEAPPARPDHNPDRRAVDIVKPIRDLNMELEDRD
jgi:hypothetical protein